MVKSSRSQSSLGGWPGPGLLRVREDEVEGTASGSSNAVFRLTSMANDYGSAGERAPRPHGAGGGVRRRTVGDEVLVHLPPALLVSRS